ALAQYYLGLKFYEGNDVLQDYKLAVKWYTAAAEQGITEAQNYLGRLYRNGNGVLQDYKRAHMWFNIAASLGNSYGIKSRDNLAKKMTPADISKARELARECIEKKKLKGC